MLQLLYTSVRTLVITEIPSTHFKQRNHATKKLLTVLAISVALQSASISQVQHSINARFWEGNWWSGNVNMGSWFSSIDTTSVFSIDDFSWGEIRTLTSVGLGDSIRISTQPFLNSGGTNYDGAYFGLGDQWAFYGGGTFVGIEMRDGRVRWYQNTTPGDSIGIYVVGEPITITMKLNTNGTFTVRSSRFNVTITPASLPSTRKWIFGSANSTYRQGFLVTSAGSPTLITEANQRPILPSRMSLQQNYPNPFNPTTTIEFSLPISSLATLRIFDILGREVATLVNEHLNAGTFKTEWDAKNMTSGTYFYRLQAGDYVATRKLLLLR